MLYTSLVSFEVLLLSKHDLYPPTTGRLTSLFQKQILPRFLDAMPFFPRKVQDFGALKAYFRPQSLVIHEGKDSGKDEFLQFRHADLFSGGSPEARLNFSARGPRNLLLHGKNHIIGPRAKIYKCRAKNECRVNAPIVTFQMLARTILGICYICCYDFAFFSSRGPFLESLANFSGPRSHW